jgi:hypothetical protein
MYGHVCYAMSEFHLISRQQTPVWTLANSPRIHLQAFLGALSVWRCLILEDHYRPDRDGGCLQNRIEQAQGRASYSGRTRRKGRSCAWLTTPRHGQQPGRVHSLNVSHPGLAPADGVSGQETSQLQCGGPQRLATRGRPTDSGMAGHGGQRSNVAIYEQIAQHHRNDGALTGASGTVAATQRNRGICLGSSTAASRLPSQPRVLLLEQALIQLLEERRRRTQRLPRWQLTHRMGLH